ncbi:pyridoxal-dependent decarboxylase [Sorangium sp. So ce726]|uniref:pyridoxal phosphate-dependent decarboxylase family protein n=1 Tax=Sorangium sp. So ce726 TaxID=3133319 RepID=UPI003F5F3857
MARPKRPPSGPHPLELPGDVMREMVELAMDRIVQHIESLPEQPMHATRGGKRVARSLREPLPERGVPYEKLLRKLFGKLIPMSLNTASPGYMGYIPGGGLFHAAVADLIADAVNRYVGVFQAAPLLVQIEANVIAWFCTMLGLPEGSGGILTTGGSLANLVAVITARRERLPPDFLRGTVYASEEAHHSVTKAALLAGFPPEAVREIPVDGRFRMRPDAAAEAVARDRARGLSPFLLVTSAGTTGTGAIDDLPALADLAEAERLWLHVDAAYGGFFALTERGRAAMRGIERADSVTLDPHKSLFLPYGTGCLAVRDREALRRAHALSASYMPPMQAEDDLVDFCAISPELSRDARGMRVWLPLKMHGASVFRAELDEKLTLARGAADALRQMAHIEVVAEPELSLLAFRARPPGVDDGPALDALNRRLLARVNAKQRVLLTGVVAGGRFLLRMCILSFRTHADRVNAALADVASSLAEVLEELRDGRHSPARGGDPRGGTDDD